MGSVVEMHQPGESPSEQPLDALRFWFRSKDAVDWPEELAEDLVLTALHDTARCDFVSMLRAHGYALAEGASFPRPSKVFIVDGQRLGLVMPDGVQWQADTSTFEADADLSESLRAQVVAARASAQAVGADQDEGAEQGEGAEQDEAAEQAKGADQAEGADQDESASGPVSEPVNRVPRRMPSKEIFALHNALAMVRDKKWKAGEAALKALSSHATQLRPDPSWSVAVRCTYLEATGDLHTHFKRHAEALTVRRLLLEAAREAGLSDGKIAVTHLTLTATLIDLDQPDEAVAAAKNALAGIMNSDDREHRFKVARAGGLYLEKKRPAAAAEIYQLALDTAETPSQRASMSHHRGHILARTLLRTLASKRVPAKAAEAHQALGIGAVAAREAGETHLELACMWNRAEVARLVSEDRAALDDFVDALAMAAAHGRQGNLRTTRFEWLSSAKTGFRIPFTLFRRMAQQPASRPPTAARGAGLLRAAEVFGAAGKLHAARGAATEARRELLASGQPAAEVEARLAPILKTLREAGMAARAWRWIPVGCGLLLLLRVAQLLSHAPLLYDAELAGLGWMAWELQSGALGDPSIPDLFSRYQAHGASSPGSLLPVFGGALFSKLGLGPSVWALHAVAIASELLAFAVLLRMVARWIAHWTACLAAAVAWVMVPAFVAMWQLIPDGNHTESLVFPLIMGAFMVARDPNERPAWHWLWPTIVGAAAVVLYELNLPAVIAFGGAALLHPAGPARLRGLLSAMGALGLALATLGWLGDGHAVSQHALLGWIELLELKAAGVAGHQAEILVLPLLLAAFTAVRDPNERPTWHWLWPTLLGAAAVAMYELNLLVVLAFGGAALLHRGWRARVGALLSTVGALAILWWLGDDHASPQHALLSWLELAELKATGVAAQVWQMLPAAPQQLGAFGAYRAVALGGLLVATLVSLGRPSPRVRGARYAALWAVLALAAPAAVHVPIQSAQYLITALYALLLCWTSLAMGPPARWLQWSATLALGALGVAGLVDNLQLVHPTAWSSSLAYDGAALHRELGITELDPDEVPFYNHILGTASANHWVGFASRKKGPPLAVDEGLGPVGSHDQEPFTGWPRPGALGEAIAAERAGLDDATEMDLLSIGRGAWVVCQRDLACVRQALEGLPEPLLAEVMAGAQAQATEQLE